MGQKQGYRLQSLANPKLGDGKICDNSKSVYLV